jgi:hypothetical protein
MVENFCFGLKFDRELPILAADCHYDSISSPAASPRRFSMSITGISGNLSTLSTNDVQAEEQYTEDAQLLAQTLQTQSLQGPASNAALSDTANLLNSVLPATLTNTSILQENAPSTSGGLLTSLDQELTSAPSQASSFGIVASNETAAADNTEQTSNATGSNSQPGTLQSLIQEIQQEAQQAYATAQQQNAASNAKTTLAAG